MSTVVFVVAAKRPARFRKHKMVTTQIFINILLKSGLVVAESFTTHTFKFGTKKPQQNVRKDPFSQVY